MDNRNIKIIIIILLSILSVNGVFALGISSPYWKSNPLKMYPGETREVSFVLANAIDEQTDAEAFVDLKESAGIAEIISKTEYSIPPGEKDKVVLKISIPKEAQIGDSYNVQFSVRPSPEEGTGNVQLEVEYNVDFPVVVVVESEITPQPEGPQIQNEKTNTIIITLIIIIIIIIALYLVLKRKK